MGSEITLPKALATAYRCLARRSYSHEELRAKLLQKGFVPAVTEEVLKTVSRQGYLNDEEISLRWALSLVEHRSWGREKISAYLLRKGISRDLVGRVQKQVWQEYDEEAVARSALKKHFTGSRGSPSAAQKARFLQSRGFPADVIYRCLNISLLD